MKDAKGHGSDSRGAISDADAAKALAGGGAKSEPVPVHPGAAGRTPEWKSPEDRLAPAKKWVSDFKFGKGGINLT